MYVRRCMYQPNSFAASIVHRHRRCLEIHTICSYECVPYLLSSLETGEAKQSPSGQGIIHNDGSVEIISTHEQVQCCC